MPSRWLSLVVPLVLLGCGPEARVESASDLGPLETNPLIRGRDGGYSTLAFGRSIWLYGDTILAEADENGSTWHNNSVSWTADLDAWDGVTGFEEPLDSVSVPVSPLRLTPAEIEQNETGALGEDTKWILWPADLVEDAARERALVFYFKLRAAPGAFNLETVGTSLAVWESLEVLPERVEVRPESDEPTLLFSGDEPQFGAGAMVEDELLYTYACTGATKNCLVARVELAEALDRSRWRFWNGSGWGEDWRNAKGVMSANDIMTVHYSEYLDAFIALYSQPLSNDVRFRTAPRPEGPWSTSLVAFTAKAPVGEGTAYSAVAHGELAHDAFEYVSYHRETGDFESEIRLVQVELSRR